MAKLTVQEEFLSFPELLLHTLPTPDKMALKKGSKRPLVVIVRKLLEDAGYLPHPKKYKNTFDDELEEVVKKFQKDKKLTVDGTVGEKTAYELNTEWYNKRGGLPNAYYQEGHNTIISEVKDPTPFDEYVTQLNYKFEFLHHFIQYDTEDPKPFVKSYLNEFIIGHGGGIQSLSYNIDAEALTAEMNVKFLIGEDNPDMDYYTAVGQVVRVTITSKKGNKFFSLIGYVASKKMEQSGNELYLSFQIKQQNIDNNMVWNYDKTLTRSQHLQELIKLSYMDIYWDLRDLDDKQITISTETSTESTDGTNTTTTTSSGDGTKTISECFDMAKPFIHPGHSGVYQTGTSTHDPETAWKAYQNGTRHFDCFGCSAFLFYVISNFAKKAVRVIHRYSASAGSGTHYTVQLKNENGEWYDPREEYRKLDSYLRVNSGKILGIHQVYEG